MLDRLGVQRHKQMGSPGDVTVATYLLRKRLLQRFPSMQDKVIGIATKSHIPALRFHPVSTANRSGDGDWWERRLSDNIISAPPGPIRRLDS